MSDLKSILSNFNSITLNEMDNVKLMSRVDTKFAFKSEYIFYLLKNHGSQKKNYQNLFI